MQTLTIVSNDSLVIVDGIALKVDLSGIDPLIHAVQWKNDKGHVEWKEHDLDGNRQHDTKIIDVTPYQVFVDRWTVVKTARDAAIVKLNAAIAVAKPVQQVTAPPATKPVNVIAN